MNNISEDKTKNLGILSMFYQWNDSFNLTEIYL